MSIRSVFTHAFQVEIGNEAESLALAAISCAFVDSLAFAAKMLGQEMPTEAIMLILDNFTWLFARTDPCDLKLAGSLILETHYFSQLGAVIQLFHWFLFKHHYSMIILIVVYQHFYNSCMEKGRDEHRERKKESQDDREQRKEKYKQRESNRQDDSQRHRKDRERSRSNEKKASRFKQDTRQLKPYKSEPQQEDIQPKKLFVSCRRCKQMTFSLVNRTCSSCGYPKQTRPAYFPIAKQTQVLDLVREGKLTHNSYAPVLIEVVVNDRMGKRQRIKCCPSDTVLQFKKLISARIGTRPEKIRLQKGNVIYKDHITLEDYEIKDGMGLEMYYD